MEILIAVPFIIVCVLLVLIVLLQKGRGGGLGAALGGAGSAAFGTKVGDMMTWVTIVLTGLFLLMAIGGAMYFRPAKIAAEAPSFSPNAATAITEEVHVTIQKAHSDDTIYYLKTKDLNDKTEPARGKSDEYINSIPVTPGTRIKAIAYPQRGDPSAVVSATYYAPTPLQPTLTPMPNPIKPITAAVTVTIEAAQAGDKLYYTLNGDTPTSGSRVYSAPITVDPKMTLKVIAIAENAKGPSQVLIATYGVAVLEPETPTPPVITPTTQPAAVIAPE